MTRVSYAEAERLHIGFDVTAQEKEMIERVARRYGMTQKDMLLHLVRLVDEADPYAHLDEETRALIGRDFGIRVAVARAFLQQTGALP